MLVYCLYSLLLYFLALRNSAIADKLHMSEHTLRNHLTVIYGKLGVENRFELFIYATRHGLHKPGQ